MKKPGLVWLAGLCCATRGWFLVGPLLAINKNQGVVVWGLVGAWSRGCVLKPRVVSLVAVVSKKKKNTGVVAEGAFWVCGVACGFFVKTRGVVAVSLVCVLLKPRFGCCAVDCLPKKKKKKKTPVCRALPWSWGACGGFGGCWAGCSWVLGLCLVRAALVAAGVLC